MTDQRSPSTVSPSALLPALRRRLWVIALALIMVVAGAVGFSLSQEEQYSSTASLLFRDPQLDQKLFGSSFLDASSDPAREAATNVNLLSLDVVADRTAAELGANLSGDEVDAKTDVSAEGQSDLVSVTATDPDPEFAALLANTFARQYIVFRQEADREKIREAQDLVRAKLGELQATPAGIAERRSLERRLDQLTVLASLQTGNAELAQQAEPPDSPSSPDLVKNGAVGVIIGLLVGLVLALLLDRLDRRIRDPNEMEEIVRRPVLGVVPESRALRTEGANVAALPNAELEAFGLIRANLRYFNASREVKSVLVTSAGPGDGKTTVAWNLAGAAAQAGANVALLEADLRRPTLQERLGVRSRAGLSSVLGGTTEAYDAAVQVPIGEGPDRSGAVKSVDVILSGPIPPNPTDLLESERMRDLLRMLELRYDAVFIDTPPVSAVSDAIPLMTTVDGVIVVSRLNRTTRDGLARLVRQLENLKAPTLGVVVNSIVRRRLGYGYGYGYGYEARPPEREARRASAPGASVPDRARANGAGESRPGAEVGSGSSGPRRAG